MNILINLKLSVVEDGVRWAGGGGGGGVMGSMEGICAICRHWKRAPVLIDGNYIRVATNVWRD